MNDLITSRQITEELGIRDYERVSLEKFAGFPRGIKNDPTVMQSRIKFSRTAIERWQQAIARLLAEIESVDA